MSVVSNVESSNEAMDFTSADRIDLRRFRRDRIAAIVLKAVGMLVLGSICAIVLVILLELVPLFRSVRVTGEFALPINNAIASIVHEGAEAALIVTTDSFYSLDSSNKLERLSSYSKEFYSNPDRAFKVSGTEELLISDGPNGLHFVRPEFKSDYRESGSLVSVKDIQTVSPAYHPAQPVEAVAAAKREGHLYAFLLKSGEVEILWLKEKKSLLGKKTLTELTSRLPLPSRARATAVAVQDGGGAVVVGTASGRLLLYDLRKFDSPVLISSIFEDDIAHSAIRSLLFLLGEQTLIAGTSSGTVSGWHVQNYEDRLRLKPVHRFKKRHDGIIQLSRSMRNRTFLAVDGSGGLTLYYSTTGDLLWEDTTSDAMTGTLSARGNAMITLSSSLINKYQIENPHPEVSLKSLFAKIWYEGYDRPEYVWQSSGGSDRVEAKYSLIPLIFGTLKGTFYALLFAIPFALCGAFYTSQFMSPFLKDIIKPVLETMAAFPGVVIGFIAGLWLAPLLHPHLQGLLLVPPVLLITVTAAYFAFYLLQQSGINPVKPGYEVLLLIPVVIVGIAISFYLGEIANHYFFEDNFQQFLYSAIGVQVDQRNSFIAGIAVGFVVIPIIFTISEDCLSSVPRRLSAAALALGASQWQTATKVVLPVALPGIFSAVMIGIGRAVGETMIVLMATGNTPIIDFSPFNGFRALSATIAVEMPEAPENGTLYRILFVAAFILFIVTFVINIVSEFIRGRLKRKLAGL